MTTEINMGEAGRIQFPETSLNISMKFLSLFGVLTYILKITPKQLNTL
jgi:hypothetical protein